MRRAVLRLGKRNFQLLRDQPDGFRKRNVLELLDKAENVAGSATTKAVIELPRSVYEKRRRLLLMKRTQPGKILRSGLLQFHILAHNADNVRLLPDAVCEISEAGHSK